MKNFVLTATALTVLLISCGKTETPPPVDSTGTGQAANPAPAETAPTVTAPTPAPAPAASPEAEGKTLVEGADCLSCHKVDSKLVGPAYQEVAAKYTDADVDRLAQKVIDGGKGVWGDVPMTPHAGLSKENATKMVKYVLSLKKK